MKQKKDFVYHVSFAWQASGDNSGYKFSDTVIATDHEIQSQADVDAAREFVAKQFAGQVAGVVVILSISLLRRAYTL